MQSSDKKTITSSQIRAARALLKWTAQDVADAANIGVATVRRAEKEENEMTITIANRLAIKAALEAAGIEFITENGGGPGVRLTRRD